MDFKVFISTFLYFLFVNGEQTVWLTGEDIRTPPTLACGGVDLVFLVDTSRSIWGLDFKRQLHFIEKAVSKFDIGPAIHQTRVAVISYAQSFWVRFYLNTYRDLPSLQKAIQRIPHRYGPNTRTEKPLKVLRTRMYRKWYGGRKNATHVAIIISDGRSQDRKATRKEAIKAKEAGIKLFTIGVGKRADMQELRGIASDPDDYFVFHVGNFKALDSLNYKIPTSTCDDILKRALWISTSTTTAATTSTRITPTTQATTLPPVELFEPSTYLAIKEAGRILSTTNTEVPDKSSNTLNHNLETKKLLPTTARTTDDRNNIQEGKYSGNVIIEDDELDQTILLPNSNSQGAVATLSPLQRLSVATESERSIQRLTPPTTQPNNFLPGFDSTTMSSQGHITTLSNEILNGLAAYSLKPITEDQAQIMANYVLRDVPAETYCDGKDADIYFVLDASNSIWPEDFKQQLSFVNNVIDILDVTRGNTRVGVIVYSTQIHPIVMIDSGLTKTQIKRQVNAIKYVSGRTNTSDALRFVRQYGFSPKLTREGAVKLAIILTDGISRKPIATKTESNRCREENIHLFAVGIGKKVDQTELKRIANDPDHKFMFHVDSYAALNTIKDFLAITACSVAPDQPNLNPICNGLGPMDVVFSYDSFALGSRKSQMINFFIHDILNGLDFSNGNLQVGRLTDNCPEFTDIPISAGKNLSAFANIRYPGIASLLLRMNSSFSDREEAKHLGVLFVDDSTGGIEKAIQVIKTDLDYKLMVIGIGEMQSTETAGDLCSYPKHDYFLQVPRYSSLLRARSKLLDKICTSMIAAG